MRTTIITACSGRKRFTPAQELHASSLSSGSLQRVAAAWLERLRSSQNHVPVHRLYSGRGFAEARAAAAVVGTRVHIASAGLGLVGPSTNVPSYDLTISPGLASSVLSRVVEPTCAADWWREIAPRSPYGTPLSAVLHDGVEGLFLVALPSTYLAMLAPDLLALAPAAKARVRLFCGARSEQIAPDLRPNLMLYDTRLDGPSSPIRGTRADFAQRALRHFVEHVLPATGAASAEAHGAGVLAALAAMCAPATRPTRARRADDELRARIEMHWMAAEGRSERLLRVLRDELGIACEQGRFARLFRQARVQRVALHGAAA